MRRSRSRRGKSTRRPHVTHLTPMSAPSRTTLQSYPPQGCGFLSRTTSPTANGVGSELTIRLVLPWALQPRCGNCQLHESGNAHASGNGAHLLFRYRVGSIHRVLDCHSDQVLENLDIVWVHDAWVDPDAPKFLGAGHLCRDDATTSRTLDNRLSKLALHRLEPRL